MSVPPLPARTALQVWLEAIFAALLDARDELDDASYVALIFILTDRLRAESARLLLGEALRARREA